MSNREVRESEEWQPIDNHLSGHASLWLGEICKFATNRGQFITMYAKENVADYDEYVTVFEIEMFIRGERVSKIVLRSGRCMLASLGFVLGADFMRRRISSFGILEVDDLGVGRALRGGLCHSLMSWE